MVSHISAAAASESTSKSTCVFEECVCVRGWSGRTGWGWGWGVCPSLHLYQSGVRQGRDGAALWGGTESAAPSSGCCEHRK